MIPYRVILTAIFGLVATIGPAVFLARELQGIPNLDPGLCEIQKVLPNDLYDIFFTPNETSKSLFSMVTISNREGFRDLSLGSILPCYGRPCRSNRFSCSKNRIQFHSRKKDRQNNVVIAVSVWIPLAAIFFFGAFIWEARLALKP